MSCWPSSAGTFVIGEDLGTVQDGVREAMTAGGILGTKVWWFDPAPEHWAATNLATVTTHDLPTVAGVWTGSDGGDEMGALLHTAVDVNDDALSAAVAVHAQVAASNCVLMLASVDDLAGCVERPNRPGTVSPENWSLRMPSSTEHILDEQPGRSILRALAPRNRG